MKSQRYKLWTLLSTLACMMAFPGHAQTMSGIELVSYELVSSQRVDRTRFDYVYRVLVRNATASFAADVVGTVSSINPATVIIDGETTFDDVPSLTNGAGDDTITIRQNRTQPFNAAALQWAFSGFFVPDALPPDPGATGDQSIEGIDSNANGVRDDLERAIARRVPDIANVRASLNQLAVALQLSYAGAGSRATALEVAQKIFSAIDCVAAHTGEEESSPLIAFVESAFLSTRERIRAYSDFERELSGEVFSFTSVRPGAEVCVAGGGSP